jgi:hypothetical protein
MQEYLPASSIRAMFCSTVQPRCLPLPVSPFPLDPGGITLATIAVEGKLLLLLLLLFSDIVKLDAVSLLGRKIIELHQEGVL